MRVIKDGKHLRDWRKYEHKEGGSWAFVPTMGNLHDGHISLVERAKDLADRVVVSVYVNPTQFGAGEDFASYPRTPQDDIAILEQAGVAAVFMPDENMIYPFGTEEAVGFTLPADYAQILCGVTRPTHFQGVAAVVVRLFNLLSPDIAVFGRKDFQQYWLIKRLVADLHMPVRIEGMPIHREMDGLAMSSRNRYLSSAERKTSPLLYQTLKSAEEALLAGKDIAQTLDSARNQLSQAGFTVHYLELREQETLRIAQDTSRPTVLLAAAVLGKTRLLDNIEIAATV